MRGLKSKIHTGEQVARATDGERGHQVAGEVPGDTTEHEGVDQRAIHYA